MATPRATARRLCTAVEYRLVEESFPPLIKNLDAKAVRSRIERARRLRDKHRGQSEGRAREIRGKTRQRRKAPARSNELSRAKQKLFGETLDRFEKRLTHLESAEARNSSQIALSKKALAQKRAAGASGSKTPATRTARKGMKPKPAGGQKGFFPAEGTKKGELSAAVKRGQARRDSRG